MQYYTPRYFSVQEFVPPEVYEELGDSAILVMDYYILKTADAVRSYFGKPVTVNDWKWGGKFKYRGFRPCGCKVGATYSSHKFGRALDFDVKGMDAESVRQEILNHPLHFCHITAMEKDTSWVHVDNRPAMNGGIILF